MLYSSSVDIAPCQMNITAEMGLGNLRCTTAEINFVKETCNITLSKQAKENIRTWSYVRSCRIRFHKKVR